MDPQLYKAAQSGDSDVIRRCADQLDSQLTPNQNTVLHILAQFCDSSYAVEQILGINHSLLCKQNAKGNTALHVAARNRYSGVVRALIDCAKNGEKPDKHNSEGWIKMLRLTNDNRDTALHLAVRTNCYDIVELLVKEDDELPQPRNKAGESPLYLAVERGYHDIVDLILGTCKSPSYHGPHFTTALHRAAMGNSLVRKYFQSGDCTECVKLLLGKLPNLTKEADRDGQTALHIAAKLGHQEVIKLLLSADKSVAYIRSCQVYSMTKSKTSKTALHVAVKYGHLNVVKEILSHCPDCWEMCNGDNQNILHLAVAKEQKQLLDFILDNVWASELINEGDLGGNTPLHLYAATKNLDGCNLISHIHADKNAFNFANFTPLDVVVQTPDQTERLNVIKDELERNGATRGFRRSGTRLKGKREEALYKSNQCNQLAKDSKRKDDTYLIVAALIVTVTFAAGFTVPGGYESSDGPNKGMAVLRHKPSFIVFVIADMIALAYASAAVFLQFKFSPSEVDCERWLWYSKSNTHWNIRVALMAMVTAFVSGLFAVLSSPLIKALVCYSGITSFLVFMGFFVIFTTEDYYFWLRNAGNRCKIILSLWCGRLRIAIVRFRSW
ncbi:protein ACCELERATED CELL DEATH 6 isoform X1 [Coffea arabica]|uniref:Protein ACCELERATED CELL DEATH 6 isoform X1 n=1 Tax=Coffea arabica TaxID=13443 RepID=A0A6P6V7S4_COFAR